MHPLMQKVEKLICKQQVAFLTSVDEYGFPNTKALLIPKKVAQLKGLYFRTNLDSEKVSHFKRSSKACVYIYDNETFENAMLKGLVEVLEDITHKELLWEAGDEVFYPLGVSDPNYCVLKFHFLTGRYNYKQESFNFCSTQ